MNLDWLQKVLGFDGTGRSSAMMGRYLCSRTLRRSPMSQPSACGPLQQGRVSLHKRDTLEKTSATHQTGRLHNPNSRNHRGRRDYNRAAHTGGTIDFDRMPIPPA